MSQWAPLRIRDIGELFDGPHATPKSKGKVSTDYIFLSISSLENGRLNLKESPSISEEDYLSWTRRVTPRAQDLVFSYETRLGEGALIPAGLTCCLGRRMALLRPNQKVIEPRFLLYLFLGPKFQQTIAERTIHGSTVNRIALNDFPDFPILLPDITEQRRIAGVLGALDDKIESNQNLTEVIPSLIDAQIHHALSDGSGDSIPVSKLAKFVNGGAYTKEASGTGRMVIRIADLNTGPGASTIYNDIDVPGDRLAHFGDLLMSWSGSLGVYVWVREEAIVNQHIFKVIFTDFPAWLVHNRLNVALDNFRAIAADKATTMGHIQRKHLDETFVEVPNAKLEQLNHLCVPLWNRFISAQLESMRLAELRDALLPELMSGRMRVDEAGCLVSEALDEEVADV